MPEQLSFDFISQEEIKRLRQINQQQREEIALMKEKAFQVRVLLMAGMRAFDGH